MVSIEEVQTLELKYLPKFFFDKPPVYLTSQRKTFLFLSLVNLRAYERDYLEDGVSIRLQVLSYYCTVTTKGLPPKKVGYLCSIRSNLQTARLGRVNIKHGTNSSISKFHLPLSVYYATYCSSIRYCDSDPLVLAFCFTISVT